MLINFTEIVKTPQHHVATNLFGPLIILKYAWLHNLAATDKLT